MVANWKGERRLGEGNRCFQLGNLCITEQAERTVQPGSLVVHALRHAWLSCCSPLQGLIADVTKESFY